ncbi:hypothetical protein Syun_017769 [Stephania yunnanensis]|uniref:RING-type domain-containing protein n=1 Tax=Stephania yunnanensis TaxID=152371 RepID=A0AAP0J9W8_9MAGN
MAALALLNWGNVHLCKVRKRVYLTKDAFEEDMLEEIKVAYDWAQNEYMKARQIYEEALVVKLDFYEAFLAMGLQQFEQARLSWYYAIGKKVDLATWPSTEVFELFNSAEDNIHRGKTIWDQTVENYRVNELSKPNKIKFQMQEMGLSGLFTDMSPNEVVEHAATIVSQINLLLGLNRQRAGQLKVLFNSIIMKMRMEWAEKIARVTEVCPSRLHQSLVGVLLDFGGDARKGVTVAAAASSSSSSLSSTSSSSSSSCCAICLEKIELQEIALVKGCEHAYWWATYSKNPICPQCKYPFEFLILHRALDGGYVAVLDFLSRLFHWRFAPTK